MPNQDIQRTDNRELAGAFMAMRSRLGMPLVQPRRIDPLRVGRPPKPKPEPAVVSWLVPLNMLLLPNWRAIVKLVALKHRVSVQSVLGFSRRYDIARARQEAMFLIYTHCEPNFTMIGRLFGDRDHTTVLHLVKNEAKARGVTLPPAPTGARESARTTC